MNIKRTVAAGVISMALCILLMTITNLIPTSMIQDNSVKSAEYLKEIELFHYTIDDYVNSEQDNYADAHWMSVSYAIDSRHPFTSGIWAWYSQLPYENIDDGFYKLVRGEQEVNESYSRYWHGPTVLIRPLLMVTDLVGIRIIFGLLVTFLIIAAFFMLWRMGQGTFGVCLLLSFLAIHPWMLYVCLEYSSMFLVMAVSLVAMLILIKANRTDMSTELFAVTGVVSCFMDFLTTETISFTLPVLVLIICTKDRIASVTEGVRLIVRNGISWMMGYVGCFVTKLGLVFLVCGREEFFEALSVAAERTAGVVYIGSMVGSPTASAAQRFSGALWHNLAAILPTHAYNMSAADTILIVGGIVFVSAVIIYLFRQEVTAGEILLPVILALLPYARFLALSSHSYVHYFFTYRAQMVTVLVVVYLTYRHGIKNIPGMLRRGDGHGKK